METMKKLGLAAMILVSSFYSCEKSDLKPEGIPFDKEQSAVAANPMWRIRSFQWHNKENNDHFVNHVFRFENNGVISVIHDGEREFGKWVRRNDILQIEFQKPPLNELNNNWTVVEQTRRELILGGLSPYDHSSEIVEFENMNFGPAH